MRRKSAWVIFIGALLLVAALPGCGGGETATAPSNSAIESISQPDTSREPVVVRQPTVSLSATAAPAEARSRAPAATTGTLLPATSTALAVVATAIPSPASTAPSAPGAKLPVPASTTLVPIAMIPIPSANPLVVTTPARTPMPVGTTGSASGPQSGWNGPAECQGGDVAYTAPPVSLEDISIIEPMGKLHGSHVTPTDHTYIRHNQLTAFEKHHEAVWATSPP